MMTIDRAAAKVRQQEQYASFRPGDIVTVRKTVKSSKRPGVRFDPGDEAEVLWMDNRVTVHVRRISGGGHYWFLYDGNVRLLRRPA